MSTALVKELNETQASAQLELQKVCVDYACVTKLEKKIVDLKEKIEPATLLALPSLAFGGSAETTIAALQKRKE